jgi:hypothetical protein
MRMRQLASMLCGVVMVALAPLEAQVPLDAPSTALRSHLALEALDRYLETWNSRDPRLWASSLHYPHIRPSAGVFEMSRTAEEYAAGVNFNQTVATGWDHTEWDSRHVLQVGLDKVHATGQWTRYTLDGRPLTSSSITYIVTNVNGRWGVLSRFAVGAARAEAGEAGPSTASALEAVKAYFLAWNAHDPKALANAMHFPHVRLADSTVEVWHDAEAFLGGPEPGRQRTWPATTIDRPEVVQVNATAANVTLHYTRRNRDGEAMSTYEALFLVTRRDGAWKVQARSLIGP